MRPVERWRGVSQTSRVGFWLILAAIVGLALYALFNSQYGQYVLICCLGVPIALLVLGGLSEMGMRRPR